MKIKLIKTQIRKKLLRYAPILAVLLVTFIAAQQYKSHNVKRLEENTAKVNSLTIQITKIKTDYDESEKLLKIYLAMQKNKFPTDEGYSFGRDRLKVLLPLIQSMKDLYSFKTLNLTLSEIKNDKESGINSFELYINSIDIDFSGVSDEYVYSFINDLKKVVPGYLDVKTLSIVRNQDITPETVDEYFKKSGKPLVQGSMQIQWATLKNISKADDKTKADDKKDETKPQ